MEMEMEFLRKLPTPQELKEQFPVSTEVVAAKAQRDEEIRNIFEGKDDRLILVIGPCSADNEDAVIDYISRLRTVQEKVKDKIFIIPRIYTNKPRTIGVGYKGMLHQPDPDKAPDLYAGIMAIRKMAINEADRSDIGRHFYENGPKKGWLLLNHYLQKQVGQNVLVPCDVWVCAMHLKALLESEVVEQHALGVIKEIDDTQLKNVVTRAVSVFLKAYQTQDKNSAE